MLVAILVNRSHHLEACPPPQGPWYQMNSCHVTSRKEQNREPLGCLEFHKSELWLGSSVFYKWTLRLRLVIEWRQKPCIWPVPEHFGGNELSEHMMRYKHDSLKIPEGSLSQEHLKVNLVFNSSGVRRPGCKPQPGHCWIWDFGYTTHHPSFITDLIGVSAWWGCVH